MKVGDLVEHNSGPIGLVTAVEMMYPYHPESPVGRIEVEWLGVGPDWWRRGLKFDVTSIKRVVSRAAR